MTRLFPAAPRRTRRTPDGLVIDLYAGGGGASIGIAAALGRPVSVAINHCANAIDMHARNHGDTIHLRSDVDAVSPAHIVGQQDVLLLHASPTCTHHSRARGKAPKTLQLREQGWSVLRWVKECKPRILTCENVTEWEDWGPLHPDDHPDPKLRGQAIKERKGETWRAWVQELRDLGYVVEWRRLVAANYGQRGAKIGSGRVNATTRERLFVVARRDGLPIVWPAPTHGPRDSAEVKAGRRAPWLPVADCIDWSIPMCSIFATRDEAKTWAREHGTGIPQRPLAEATQRRIAEGMKRFVFSKRRRPFLVNLTHGTRLDDVDQPAKTITAANRGEKAVVAPIVTKARSNGWDRPGSGTVGGGDPLGTSTTTEQHAVAAAHLVQYNGHGEGRIPRAQPADAPLPTVTTEPRFGVAAATLLNLSHGGRPEDIAEPANTLTATPKGGDRVLLAAHLMSHYGASVGRGVDDPCPTVTGGAGGHQALVGVGLVNTRNGEREGQAPRVRDLGDPAPTTTAQGSQGGVAATWCIKHYGGPNGHTTPGSSAEDPAPSFTGRDSTSVGAVFLDKLHGSARAGISAEEPAPTVAAGGNRGGGHAALVQADIRTDIPPAMVRRARQTAAFLSLYYSGGGISSSAGAPCPTIPTKDRLALILVELETTDGPATLATVEIDGQLWIVVDICMRMLTPRELARAQGFADTYWLPAKKSDAIARIGNSVVPQCLEAIVRANLPRVADDDAMAAK